LNSRERVLTALRHEEPDRIPVYNSFTPEVREALSESYNIDKSEIDFYLCHDCFLVELGVFNGFYLDFTKEDYKDRWGIQWKRIKNNYGFYMEIDTPPLHAAKDVYDYRFPYVDGEPFYEELLHICRRYGHDFAIIGGSVSIFENSWYLRGFQNFLEDLICNKDEAHFLVDHVMEYNLALGFKIIDAGVDILYIGDDFGMQTGLIISPQIWKEFFLPRWEKLIANFKKRKPGLIIAYHSDGNILPILDDLVELGVDVLNPVQPDCMDPELLKRRYGRRLAFWGTIDVQHTLFLGTQDDVRNEVIKRLKTIAPGGGLLLGSTHNVQMSENAIDNLREFYETVRTFGSYPITV